MRAPVTLALSLGRACRLPSPVTACRHRMPALQAEVQGTKRQLHAFMSSLMQLKSSMDSAGAGDVDHALELLQSSSWSQSLQGAWRR